MWWPFQWLVIYVLGGVTFVPLVIVLLIGYVYRYGSTPIGDTDPDKLRKATLQRQSERDEYLAQAAQIERADDAGSNDDQKDSLGAKEKAAPTPSKPLSGWLTVRRQFKPSREAISLFSTVGGTDLAGAEVIREEARDDEPLVGVGGDEGRGAGIAAGQKAERKGTTPSLNGSTHSTTSSTSTALPPSSSSAAQTHPSTMSGRIAQTYRSMVEARAARTAPPKEYFFCVLKGSVLFLYEDEEQSDCVAAIGIDKYSTSVETPLGRFEGKEGEMFAKRNAVVLRIYPTPSEEGKKGLPVLVKGMGMGMGTGERDKVEEMEMENAPWYLFAKSNTKMEDWYLALTAASALKPSTADVFSPNDMQDLINVIDSEADPIPMRWLNGFLGRIFFGLYRTAAVEQFIIGKIMKKLSKVPRPSFLSPIIIREVNIGTSPPFFSKPMLKDLTADGTAAFEVNVRYRARPNQPNAEVRITLATTATIPTGFKPYNVDLVLAVVLKSLEGNMILQIKKPPSNRVWYGFTTMPKMEIEILPVVSERKIQIGMVLKAMEKQLRDVIAESVVLPNMDDLAFFNTSALDIRGGIFSEAGKLNQDAKREEVHSKEAALQTGQEAAIATSHEDPGSATVESQLRKRAPVKALTVDHLHSSFSEEHGMAGSLSRTDTAPALVNVAPATSTSTGKATAVQATRKWFGHTPRATSISSQPVIDSVKALSTESLPLAPAPAQSSSADIAQNLAGALAVSKEGTAEPSSERAEDLTTGPSTAALKSGPLASASPAQPSVDRPQPGQQPLTRVTSGSKSSHTAPTSSLTPEHTSAASPPVSIAPSDQSTTSNQTQALINSIRARDKQAIASQVNATRDSIKKWGINFAAKRRGEMKPTALADAKEPNHPAALYRPPEETGHNAASSSRGVNIASVPGRTSSEVTRTGSPGRSLQDRLNAAAQAATLATSASSPPTTAALPGNGHITGGRQRSGSSLSQSSTGSRHAPGTTKSGIGIADASASPPKFGPSTAKPTIGVDKDPASAHVSSAVKSADPISIVPKPLGQAGSSGASKSANASSSSSSRSSYNSSSVHTHQPYAGRSMVVPRVVRRPGEVTGIGSSPDGMVRRISDGGEVVKAPGSTHASAPAEEKAKRTGKGSGTSTPLLLTPGESGSGQVPLPAAAHRTLESNPATTDGGASGTKTPPDASVSASPSTRVRRKPVPTVLDSSPELTDAGHPDSAELLVDVSDTPPSEPSVDRPQQPTRHDSEPMFDLDLTEVTTQQSSHAEPQPGSEEISPDPPFSRKQTLAEGVSDDSVPTSSPALTSPAMSLSGAEDALRKVVAKDRDRAEKDGSAGVVVAEDADDKSEP